MIDIPPVKTFEELGLNQYGQSPLSFSGSEINRKTSSFYEEGVPSNFIQDGDVVVRLNVIDGYLQSDGFVSGATGWRIDSDGNAEFNSGTFRGSLAATTIDIGGSDTTSFHTDINGNSWWGAAAFADAPAKITSAGAATFTSVSITGYVASGGAATDVNNGATTISGTKITASSITASQIAASTITSSQLNATSINAMGITAGSVDAGNITGTTISGKTVQTSASGNKIAMNSNNHLYFYNADNSAAVADLYATTNDFRIAATDNIYLYTNTTTLALNVGADRTVPRSDNVHNLGTSANAFGAMYAHSFNDTSDRRLKKDIKTIQSALDKVMKLRGVSFKWKKNNKKNIGLIAQEVKKIIPEVVSGKGGKERYTIEYGKMVGLLVEAIKEQQKQIEELKKI